MTHICVSKLTIIGSDNGLLPGRRQAIIWTNAGILIIGPLGTNFSEILIEIYIFSFKKMHLKMSSRKWRPFCLGLNVLTSLDLVQTMACRLVDIKPSPKPTMKWWSNVGHLVDLNIYLKKRCQANAFRYGVWNFFCYFVQAQMSLWPSMLEGPVVNGWTEDLITIVIHLHISFKWSFEAVL